MALSAKSQPYLWNILEILQAYLRYLSYISRSALWLILFIFQRFFRHVLSLLCSTIHIKLAGGEKTFSGWVGGVGSIGNKANSALPHFGFGKQVCLSRCPSEGSAAVIIFLISKISKCYPRKRGATNWHERVAFQRPAFGRSTTGNDVVATIFIRFFLFHFFPSVATFFHRRSARIKKFNNATSHAGSLFPQDNRL